MSTWIDGTVGGGKLYCRKSPSTSAAAWGRFENGTKIIINKRGIGYYLASK